MFGVDQRACCVNASGIRGDYFGVGEDIAANENFLSVLGIFHFVRVFAIQKRNTFFNFNDKAFKIMSAAMKQYQIKQNLQCRRSEDYNI